MLIQADLVVIEGYLPKLADEATTRKWVQEAIAATGAVGKSTSSATILNTSHALGSSAIVLSLRCIPDAVDSYLL
jgi:hypothetical protein